VFSLIATWSMPGFPATGSDEPLPRQYETSRPWIASARPGSTIPSSPLPFADVRPDRDRAESR
jgi:hypothetical protein